MRLLNCMLYIAILGIVSHYVGEALPRNRFNPDCFPYRQFAWEEDGRIYKALHVKQWKNKLPDASKFCKDMVPKELKRNMTSRRVGELVVETCVAEFVHLSLCLFSVGVCIIWEGKVGIFLWVLCIVVNMLFVIIQRYNRPHLIQLEEKLRIREERLDICTY